MAKINAISEVQLYLACEMLYYCHNVYTTNKGFQAPVKDSVSILLFVNINELYSFTCSSCKTCFETSLSISLSTTLIGTLCNILLTNITHRKPNIYPSNFAKSN